MGTPGAAVPTARLATFPTCQANADRGLKGLGFGFRVRGFRFAVYGLGSWCGVSELLGGMTFTEYRDWLSRFCLAHVGGLGATLADHSTHLTRRRTQLDGMLHAVRVCVCVFVCVSVCM